MRKIASAVILAPLLGSRAPRLSRYPTRPRRAIKPTMPESRLLSISRAKAAESRRSPPSERPISAGRAVASGAMAMRVLERVTGVPEHSKGAASSASLRPGNAASWALLSRPLDPRRDFLGEQTELLAPTGAAAPDERDLAAGLIDCKRARDQAGAAQEPGVDRELGERRDAESVVHHLNQGRQA